MQPAVYDSETAEREDRMDAALGLLANRTARAIIRLLAERPRAISAVVKALYREDEREEAYILSLVSALDGVGIVVPGCGVTEPWLVLSGDALAEVGAFVTGLNRRTLRAVVPDDAGRDEPEMPHYRDAFPGG